MLNKCCFPFAEKFFQAVFLRPFVGSRLDTIQHSWLGFVSCLLTSFYDKWQENGPYPLVLLAPAKDKDNYLGISKRLCDPSDRRVLNGPGSRSANPEGLHGGWMKQKCCCDLGLILRPVLSDSQLDLMWAHEKSPVSCPCLYSPALFFLTRLNHALPPGHDLVSVADAWGSGLCVTHWKALWLGEALTWVRWLI